MRPIQQTQNGASRSIPLSDGHPIHGDVVAVIDESAPTAGSGVYYIVTAVRILDGSVARREALSVVAGRSRPFHYHSEGPEVRKRMADTIEACGMIGEALWLPVKRKGQTAARARLLKEHALRLQADGIDHLIIESGHPHTDQRDHDTLRAWSASAEAPPFAYDWRSKSEPLLWVADAFCGAAAEHLLGMDSPTYDQIAAAGLIDVGNL